MSKNKILLVDDEEDILDLLEYNLEKEGYEVKRAADGLKALEIAKDFQPQMVLLDVMMPRLDGIETCRRMRQISALEETYIVFLTARSEEFSEIAAFEAGANDYLNKPIKPRALISRVNAYFKRENKQVQEQLMVSFANLIIDRSSYTVSKNDEKIILPKKEFELLYFLSLRPDVVFSREDLLKHIWGTDVYVVPRTVDVHVRKVREKIGEEFIVTVKGIGYKFCNP
ncbi:MAG: response regulator transcription factor [Cytophagaceae bacterium]|nr:response regulator transcription factor [Cytophagaceae bacterium]